MMDDGIGLYLVEAIMSEKAFSDIEFVVGESDIDYCLDQIIGATFIIIIDAVILDRNPGEIFVIPLSKLNEQQPFNISPHNLHSFNVLYQRYEETEGSLIAIEPFEISFQIGLSQTLELKLNHIYNILKSRIDRIITKRLMSQNKNLK